MFVPKRVIYNRVMYNDIRVFEKYPEIRAAFTTRDCEGKARKHEMAPQLAAEGRNMACLGIIHSDIVVTLDDITVHEAIEPGRWWVHDCDGAITNKPGLMLTTTTGDCLAVYAYDPVKKVIGLAHAGWRGVLAGMPARLIEKMMDVYGCDPSDMEVWIGPGIGLCCFEVSEDVKEDFLDKYPWAENYTIDLGKGKYKIDLKGISMELLEMTGVENFSVSPECTCCMPERFYSYRRSADKDRMLQYIEICK